MALYWRGLGLKTRNPALASRSSASSASRPLLGSARRISVLESFIILSINKIWLKKERSLPEALLVWYSNSWETLSLQTKTTGQFLRRFEMVMMKMINVLLMH
jgi:hypothetical protein